MGHLASVEQTEQSGLSERLDPRLRVLMVAFFSVLTVSLYNLQALFAALLFSLTIMVLARVPVRSTLRRMAAMDGFIVFMLVLLPFTIQGQVLFTVGDFEASYEGLIRAVEIALKANAIVLMVLSLVGTMEPVTLGHALHRLKVPLSLIHLLLFSVRYIHVLQEEYHRMRQAMKARGFKPRNSLHTWRSFGYLVGMMLIRAIERSERILDAMKCRGFTGQFPVLTTFRTTRLDWFFLTLFVVGGIVLLGLEKISVIVL